MAVDPNAAGKPAQQPRRRGCLRACRRRHGRRWPSPSVPLYRLFCQVTGFGGTTQRAERRAGQRRSTATSRCASTPISRRRPALDVRAGPAPRHDQDRRDGADRIYRATNRSTSRRPARAIFNVTPRQAGAYFNKIECFCFTEQTLKPGETVDMPVIFFVDPEIADDPRSRQASTRSRCPTHSTRPDKRAAGRGSVAAGTSTAN